MRASGNVSSSLSFPVTRVMACPLLQHKEIDADLRNAFFFFS